MEPPPHLSPQSPSARANRANLTVNALLPSASKLTYMFIKLCPQRPPPHPPLQRKQNPLLICKQLMRWSWGGQLIRRRHAEAQSCGSLATRALRREENNMMMVLEKPGSLWGGGGSTSVRLVRRPVQHWGGLMVWVATTSWWRC